MRKEITIIEDNEDLRNLIRMSLQAAGYEVIAQSDGNNLANNMSDLYIIDINLGGVSGLDLCKQIKALRYNQSIPVIIIISANPDVRQLAIEACANDTLPKPFTAKELVKKVSEYLPLARVA